MKILFPDNWMQKIVPFINQDNDFILVGSMTQMDRIPADADWSKVILYNWDHYSFIDMNNRPDWVRFHKACRKAREVWMPTKTHADYFKRDSGIDSYVINLACVLPEEWNGENKDHGYAMMSSRLDEYKRFPMFVQACEDLGISYRTTHPSIVSRESYIETMKNCRFYVQASLDESLGGLSLMEAVWNKKPVLMSDSIKGGIEVYGDTIDYFKSDSVEDFKKMLKAMHDFPSVQGGAFDRIKNFTPEGVAQEINKRISWLKSTSLPLVP